MTGIIESFVIAFALDPKEVAAGAKRVRDELKKTSEAADSSGKQIETVSKHASNAMVTLRNEAVGLFLALAGFKGLKDFTLGVIDSDAKMGRFASNMGMSTREVGAWSAAVQEMGGNATDAEQAFGKMAHVMAQMKMGLRPDNPGILQMFGINQETATDPTRMLMQISAASQRMNKLVFNEMATQLGFSPEMIALLEKGPAYLSHNMDRWRKYGDEIQKNAIASQHLQTAFADLRMTLETQLRPAIEKLASFIEWVAGKGDTLHSMADPSSWIKIKHTDKPAKSVSLSDMWNSSWFRITREGARSSGNSAGSGHAAARETMRVAGTGRLAQFAAYFRAQGFTMDQSLGIAAGILAESGGNPNAVNRKSGAFGLGQWLGDRKKRLIAMFGSHPTEKQQLQFLAWELKGGDAGGRYVGQARSADDAVLAYILKFMRPQGQRGEHLRDALQDIARARKALGSMGGGNTTITVGPVTIVNPKDSHEIQRNLAHTMKQRGLAVQADGPYN